MKLRYETDFLILEGLEEHGRNVATNLSHHIDRTRKNINVRLPVLQDYGLVNKIGPVEHSGLYEINDYGRTALHYQDQYEEVDDFEALLENAMKPSAAETSRSSSDGTQEMAAGDDD
ncbi:ArsR family transcriptional regulator [Natrarchaeobaculum sulfurireducens]|uniref:Transcriptional regulator, MarR family n=1 Tax=Natrarchaeobaculum sulfurireducens TaxID=2044521 RepID=A0A346PHI1_9EURY|nr:ArsR family transcriptional regulator [Natrarchaeobaculum sulfurireducens]AXR78976.1 Transcriptional regulator, MarR family [Natrarchaeobaculum sulfurireducens]